MSMEPEIAVTKSSSSIYIDIPAPLIPVFKLMIRRALNTWPDAHPALKDFGDTLEYDKHLQDYWSQRSDKRAK